MQGISAMSDLLATALGLGFALLVCLLAVQAILSPWLRIRRAPGESHTRMPHMQNTAVGTTQQPETNPAHS